MSVHLFLSIFLSDSQNLLEIFLSDSHDLLIIFQFSILMGLSAFYS